MAEGLKRALAALLMGGLLLAGPAMAQAPKRPPGPAPVLVRELFIREAGPELVWRWRAAPEVGMEPTLLRAMRGEALATLANERAEARRLKADMLREGFPFRAHETLTDWTVTVDTPALLVLKGEVWRYTGGAHGNTSFAGRLWDRKAQRSLMFEALFLDWPRARRLLEPIYCAALAAEQRRRREGALPDADMGECPALAEQLILPVAGPQAVRADGVLVVLPPYVAGPYVEGSYELRLRWPDGMAGFVAPQWRAALGVDEGRLR